MNNTEIKNLLLDIPIKLCRNMNNEFIKSILKDLKIDFSLQHYMIMKVLEGNKHLYVTEFVDRLGITKSQMTALVDKLIKMGYVSRINDINDRRKIYLSVTKSGREITSKINQSIDNQINNHLIRLTQEELEALEKGLLILQKLCFNCNNKNKENGEK